MSRLNFENRTLAIMDNLRFLRSLNNECIDLIAIDPPYAANETFTSKPKPAITQAEFDEEVALAAAHGVSHNEGIGETRVKDYWNWDEDIHPDWKARIAEDYDKVLAVIQAVEACATENEAAYICSMAVRLIECHRVLQPTGSIYVHCDDHANSYLRILLDAIFGAENFRNELNWNRSGGKSDAKKWGRVSDHLLYYTKSRQFTWNQQYQPLNPEYVRKTYRFDDNDGRGLYRKLPLHAAGTSNGESGIPWGGYDPGARGNHWRTPTRGIMSAYIREHDLIPGWPYAYPGVHARLAALDNAGLIAWSRNGVPEIKTYLSATNGIAASDFIADIPMASGNEDMGYSTQKPLELYERIVKASSNPGDVVLDIFAGCATTAVAAERLGRQWLACDMAYRSWTMLKRRFYLNGYALSDMTDATRDALKGNKAALQVTLQTAVSRTIGPDDLPERDDEDPSPHQTLRQSRRRGNTGTTQTATWSGRIPKDDAKQMLIDRFGPVCWGCGYEPRRPNGSLDLRLLELDHIRARRASEGKPGGDELFNLALLHTTCNGIKKNKLTLEQLREHNALNGLLYVASKDDLIDLYEAQEFAYEQIQIHTAKYGLLPRLADAAA